MLPRLLLRRTTDLQPLSRNEFFIPSHYNVMTKLTTGRKVQEVKHLEVICATTGKNTHFIFPCLLPTINRIVMLMKTSREWFISLASPSINHALSWCVPQLPIFICITETGMTTYSSLQNSSCPTGLFTTFSWCLLTLEQLSTCILHHRLAQPTRVIRLLYFLMVT